MGDRPSPASQWDNSQEKWTCWHFGLELGDPGDRREWISVVESTQSAVFCYGSSGTLIIIKLSLMKIPQWWGSVKAKQQKDEVHGLGLDTGSNVSSTLLSFGPQSVQHPSHAPGRCKPIHSLSLTMVPAMLPITEVPPSSIPSTVICKHTCDLLTPLQFLFFLAFFYFG